MARTSFIVVLVLFLVAPQIVPIGRLRAQAPGTAGHEHMTEVACVDVPPGGKRPEVGCFNIGSVTGLHFSQASVYWHLRAFPSRKSAETAKSATGIVVEEDGRVWPCAGFMGECPAVYMPYAARVGFRVSRRSSSDRSAGHGIS